MVYTPPKNEGPPEDVFDTFPFLSFMHGGEWNPNNLAESEYLRNRIVPFLILRK